MSQGRAEVSKRWVCKRIVQLFLASLILVQGCSSGGSDSTGDTQLPQSGAETSTIIVRQTIRDRAVPSTIDQVRITGFKYAVVDGVLDPLGGGATYPAQVLTLAPSYTLEGVPSITSAVRIEYLDEGQTVGVYVQEIDLVPGQLFEIVDPAFVSRPDGVDAFALFVDDHWAFAPPGERPVVVHGVSSYPSLDFAVPEMNSVESVLFGAPRSTEPSSNALELSEGIRAFTAFSSSDESVLKVGNSGLFNSSYRSGTLNPISSGDVTVQANFLGTVAQIDLRVVSVQRPFVRSGQLSQLDQDPTTVQRINSSAELVYEDRPTEERDVASELLYRPSDKPEVADWDTTPGREGFLIRGGQSGRVILWAQHPNNSIWIPLPVENL